MLPITRAAIVVALMASAAAHAAEPDGASLYANHCSSCHGRWAEGDGPMVPIMTIAPPSLRTLRARNADIYPADAIAAYIDGRRLVVSHGDRQMPVWGDVFQSATGGDEALVAARIKAIVAFIETLQYR
jgi:mono/diheme cytochrome c family protein